MVNIDHDYSWAIALLRLNYYREGFKLFAIDFDRKI